MTKPVELAETTEVDIGSMSIPAIVSSWKPWCWSCAKNGFTYRNPERIELTEIVVDDFGVAKLFVSYPVAGIIQWKAGEFTGEFTPLADTSDYHRVILGHYVSDRTMIQFRIYCVGTKIAEGRFTNPQFSSAACSKS